MASVYSIDQLNAFLAYLDMPIKYRLESNPPRDLSFLTNLHTHMLSKIPYENLTIHYSKTHTINIDPHVTYKKTVVDNRGRGGYCMENSLLYNQVLKGLGFHAFTVGVRIRHRVDGVPQGDFSGFVHLVNIVTLLDGTRWAVDVGFGGDGPIKPLPLVEGHITSNIGTQEVRLVQDYIPAQTERTPERKLWIYQYRNSIEKPWNSFYAFSEHLEFLPNDFGLMNHYTGAHPESFQTFTALIVKFLRRPNESVPGEEEIYGKRMLVNGVVKENLGGKTSTVQECKTEAERVEALKNWFGIELTQEEAESIAGYKTELRG